MSRRTQTWLAFALWAAAVVLASLGFTTRAIRLRGKSEEAMLHEKRAHLVDTLLWRLDAAAARILADEQKLPSYIERRREGEPEDIPRGAGLEDADLVHRRSLLMGNVPAIPFWAEDELIVMRGLPDSATTESLTLDWPALRRGLLAEIAEDAPEARLHPWPASSESADAMQRLATLPVAFDPGDLPAVKLNPSRLPGVQFVFVILWGVVLMGLVATGILLYLALDLARFRGDFVAGVTHDLRTPLTTLRLYTDMLLEGRVGDQEKTQRYLQVLSAETRRLQHLVDNVLTHARLDDAAAVLDIRPIAWSEFWEDAGGLLTAHVSRAGFDLRLEVPKEETDAMMMADRTALERILFNLLDNACRHVGDADDKRLHLAIQCEAGTIRISLRDHGPGIAPEMRPRLFEAFGKPSRPEGAGGGGVGLGLSTSRRLARAMGGDLRYESGSPPPGSEFVIALPAAPGRS